MDRSLADAVRFSGRLRGPVRRACVLLHELEYRAAPAIFTVTNTNDGPVSNAGDLPGSLRQAVFDANANPGADNVAFDATFFSTPRTITLTAGEIAITDAVTIAGPGPALATVSGNNASRIFDAFAAPAATGVNVSGLTFTNGWADGVPYGSTVGGAAIAAGNQALGLMNCVFTNNTGINGQNGGAVGMHGGTFTATDCTFSNNSSDAPSALYLDAMGKATLTSCTVSSNTSSYDYGAAITVSVYGDFLVDTCTVSGNIGGGVIAGAYGAGATVTFVNSTISGNTISASGRYGGGIEESGATVLISGTTITGNSVSGSGGGLSASGGLSVTIQNSSITNNTASGMGVILGGGGGGIGVRRLSTPPAISLTNTTVSGNASKKGGGIYTIGNLLLDSCTVSGNTAMASNGYPNTGSGGGIYDGYVGVSNSVTIRNSTISGNSAGYGGGAAIFVNSTGSITIQNSTITNNSATQGGGIASGFGPTAISLVSTIVSGNAAQFAPDISVATVNANFCAIGSPQGFNLNGTNNLPFGADLVLGPLAMNGGPTPTHALLYSSPCLNAGSNPAGLTTDQRGTGYSRVFGGQADIGAYEAQTTLPPPPPPPAVVAVTLPVTDPAFPNQHSIVNKLQVTFSEAVTFPSGIGAAFQLARTKATASDPVLGNVNLAESQSGAVVTITFSAGGAVGIDPGGSLKDGGYQLSIFANKVMGANGTLDGNGNGVPEGSPTDDYRTPTAAGSPGRIFRLFGDANGDGAVGANDFVFFRQSFNGVNDAFDFDGDGFVSTSDFAQFRNRFNSSI
jgi:Right handed beta helix region